MDAFAKKCPKNREKVYIFSQRLPRNIGFGLGEPFGHVQKKLTVINIISSGHHLGKNAVFFSNGISVPD